MYYLYLLAVECAFGASQPLGSTAYNHWNSISHFCIPIAGTQFSGIPIAGTQFSGIPITGIQPQQISSAFFFFLPWDVEPLGRARPLRGLVLTHSAASRPRSGAFGPLNNFLRQKHSLGRFAASYGGLRPPQQFSAPKVLTRPLRGLVRGPSAPSTIFCAKNTHSAASRPRSGALGPLNNFLRQKHSLGRFAASFGGLRPPQQFSAPKVLTRPLRGLVRGPSAPSTIFCAIGTHSAASRPRSWAFGPLNNFLRHRYSLGRFAASFVQFSAPKVLTRPLRGLVRGPSAPSTIFGAKGTHSAASRPRTHSAASRPRSWAFGPLNNFLRHRYSLGRFAASFVQFSAPTHSAASRPRSGAFGPTHQFPTAARQLRGLALFFWHSFAFLMA
ncbi:hypothetical protein niasHS_017205 [Heterodera schachtii]|uniref:Uncharacterized protein n=1 Tax=Heterodera schachtii TaxID=97005 RepID=A0ABD2I5A4_HETSC